VLPEISVNFLGRVDPPRGVGFTLAPESPGRAHGWRGTRPTTLDLVARLTGDRLVVEWHYDTGVLARGAIDDCAGRFRATLGDLASGPPTVEGEDVQRRLP
jgi:hypothetical protein